MRTLFECDMEDARLAEKGIVFVCPNHRCLSRTCNEEGGESDGSK